MARHSLFGALLACSLQQRHGRSLIVESSETMLSYNQTCTTAMPNTVPNKELEFNIMSFFSEADRSNK